MQSVEIVEETITLEDLFNKFGCELKENTELNVSDYEIEVLTDEGYKQVINLYATPKYEVYQVTAVLPNGCLTDIFCADNHRLQLTDGTWVFTKQLKIGDFVQHKDGFAKVLIVEKLIGEPEVMCDLEVAEIHRYYANGFLSHNSHFLVDMGAAALLQKKNVVHYTFELCERLIGIRYDSNLTNIPSVECYDHKERIKEFFVENTDKLGNLIIKEYPTRSASVNTIRSHIEKLAYNGFKPDMIIVDYAGIMRSTEKYDTPRFELISIIQELRGLAKELDVVMWTALQSNKTGALSDLIDLTNMAEAYGQGAEADFVLGLQRKPEQKATGFGTLYISKNRAGMDGIQYKIHLDTTRSKIRVLTSTEADQEVSPNKPHNNRQFSSNSTSTGNNSAAVKAFNAVLKENQDIFKPIK